MLELHLAALRDVPVVDVNAVDLRALVERVREGYHNNVGREGGGPAIADKVRAALKSLFEWAQCEGEYPSDRALPALTLLREDFNLVGSVPRDRIPSDKEVVQLMDALGVGSGATLEFDLKVSPRVHLTSRLAVLLAMDVPVRTGVGLLSLPAGAADLDRRVLKWRTRVGPRDAEITTPLSGTALSIVKMLRACPGGNEWLVPSPERQGRHIDIKAPGRLLKRLQTETTDGCRPRVANEGRTQFTPDALRAPWRALAGEGGSQQCDHRPNPWECWFLELSTVAGARLR